MSQQPKSLGEKSISRRLMATRDVMTSKIGMAGLGWHRLAALGGGSEAGKRQLSKAAASRRESSTEGNFSAMPRRRHRSSADDIARAEALAMRLQARDKPLA